MAPGVHVFSNGSRYVICPKWLPKCTSRTNGSHNATRPKWLRSCHLSQMAPKVQLSQTAPVLYLVSFGSHDVICPKWLPKCRLSHLAPGSSVQVPEPVRGVHAEPCIALSRVAWMGTDRVRCIVFPSTEDLRSRLRLARYV